MEDDIHNYLSIAVAYTECVHTETSSRWADFVNKKKASVFV